MEKYQNDSELYHYGVRGMKWGVRRYQNYDGSYTKRGLERYRKAQSAYDNAKANAKKARTEYKMGVSTKQKYKEAKGEVKISKRNLDKAYGKLKKDKLADQGKELYANGKTIGGNNSKNAKIQTGIVIGSIAAKKILEKKYGATIANTSASTIAIGGTVVNAIVAGKTNHDNKRLRAYYAHH